MAPTPAADAAAAGPGSGSTWNRTPPPGFTLPARSRTTTRAKSPTIVFAWSSPAATPRWRSRPRSPSRSGPWVGSRRTRSRARFSCRWRRRRRPIGCASSALSRAGPPPSTWVMTSESPHPAPTVW